MNRRGSRSSAFTLIEVVLGLLIGLVLFWVLFILFRGYVDSFGRTAELAALQNKGDDALFHIDMTARNALVGIPVSLEYFGRSPLVLNSGALAVPFFGSDPVSLDGTRDLRFIYTLPAGFIVMSEDTRSQSGKKRPPSTPGTQDWIMGGQAPLRALKGGAIELSSGDWLAFPSDATLVRVSGDTARTVSTKVSLDRPNGGFIFQFEQPRRVYAARLHLSGDSVALNDGREEMPFSGVTDLCCSFDSVGRILRVSLLLRGEPRAPGDPPLSGVQGWPGPAPADASSRRYLAVTQSWRIRN